MSTEDAFLCSICFNPVSLAACKIDELGRPVHEDCYAAKALYKDPSKSRQIASHVAGWRVIGRSIARIVGRK